MVLQTLWRRLSVVWVDLERSVHASPEPFFSGFHGLSGRVGSCISNDCQLVSELIDGVLDQGQMLFPIHKMTLAGCAADNQSVDAVGDLELNKLLISVQIDPSS